MSEYKYIARPSDEQLQSWSREELIDYIRMIERNEGELAKAIIEQSENYKEVIKQYQDTIKDFQEGVLKIVNDLEG